MPTTDACLAAMRSKDARFDGLFLTAVHSTGIYCRPSCPALTPRVSRVDFYPSAAAAQDAGYRACRRCRPDAVPGSPEWDVRGDTVARTMRLIGDGVVDREGVAGLAGRLGYSVRQLQRLTLAELGASPLSLARAQRSHTARLLLETTELPVADIAFAAGFGSVRSLNDAVATSFALTPTQLRHRRRSRPAPHGAGTPGSRGTQGTPQTAGTWQRVDLRLAFRLPYEPSNVFGHLVATGVRGVEEWRDGTYRRTFQLPHGQAIVALAPPTPRRPDHVATTLWLQDASDLTPAIARCRRLLDLDADPVAIDEHLSRDPALAPLVAAAPGRRVPRTVDGEEFALRAVLGQQVSTAAARTHAARIVRAHGTPLASPDPAGELTHVFPAAPVVAALDRSELAGPASRWETLRRVATALADGTVDLSPGADWDDARAGLAALRGVGPWTVELVAMRALGDPDAFPATDLGVRNALSALLLTPAHASRWSPWRSHATQYLWATLPHPINRLPASEETP